MNNSSPVDNHPNSNIGNSARKLFFIGGGSLLTHAISYALSLGFHIELVATPVNDPAINIINKLGVKVIQTDTPSTDLLKANIDVNDVVFSINNKFILGDKLLSLGAEFFNIHNGPIQSYRGIGEVCLFFAICNGESTYGVTLHKIIAQSPIDSGPVIDQLFFAIENDEKYSNAMKKSLLACREIFENNFLRIINNSYESSSLNSLGPIFSYKSFKENKYSYQQKNIERAKDLGIFVNLLPRLSKLSSLIQQ
jgi:methionyl-tRNA formyltransferase